MMQRFAANLTTLFAELPFLERFRAAAEAGFREVEFQFPYDYDTNDISERLSQYGLKCQLFNLPSGDWQAGERGFACRPGFDEHFHASVERALNRAAAFGTPFVHALAGNCPKDIDPSVLSKCYARNIGYAANRLGTENVRVLIEPINRHDMPNYFLCDFEQALQIIEDVAWTGNNTPKLLFDIYHCHRIHGNVPEWIARCAPHIAHYQIAGTPNRNEPDLGDLPLSAILDAVEKHTPGLCIGCEYTPVGGTVAGLGWLKSLQ